MKKHLAILFLFLAVPVQAATNSSINSAAQDALKDLTSSSTSSSVPSSAKPWDAQTVFPKLN